MIMSLAEVKSYLGITDSSQDNFLNQQIPIVSDAIEAYCRRRFSLTDFIQTFYREDYEREHIPFIFETFHYPVKEITKITIGDTVYTGADLNTNFRLHKPTGKIFDKTRSLYGFDQITVEYEAGFDPVPAMVQEVLCNLLQERINKKSAGVPLNFGSDVQRMSIPGVLSIDFDYTLTNNERSTTFGVILGNYLNVLDYYRSERALVGDGVLRNVEEAP